MNQSSAFVLNKGVNEKLRNWYVSNFDVQKKDDKLRNLYTTSLDIQNVVGGILVTVFVPYLLMLVPAVQKYSKEGRLWAYDKVKGLIDKVAGVDVREDTTESQGLIDAKTLDALGDAAKVIIDNNSSIKSHALGKVREK